MKIIIVSFLLLLLIFSIQIINPEPVFINQAFADTTDINPNGSSELAKLMRAMQQYTSQSRDDVKNGKETSIYPIAFDSLYTAKITKGAFKSDFYNQFADLYLASVKNYIASDKNNRLSTYNMVSACLACHSQHCPGPVPAIKKLSLDKN